MLAVRPTTSETAKDRSPSLVELPDPSPAAGEVLVAVRATALNRADLLQLRGLYPPPPGESPVPGLECSGEILTLGEGVTGWRVGDRVMALLAGGGQAERVTVPAGQLMAIPEGLGFEDAAALPEVGLTAWTNLVVEGGLEAGETVLIVAAASGVGTFATQLARELGARVIVAGRSMLRLERLRPLGADACVELGDGLVKDVRAANGRRGVDLVLDLAGGEGLARRLKAVSSRGRYVLVGVLAGGTTEIDLGDLLRRRLRLIGSVLRSRPRQEKARLVSDFFAFAGPRLGNGRLKPVVHRVYSFDRIAEAYAHLERGGVFGKLVVKVGGAGPEVAGSG
ncbi:MAG: NAD(P)H-quinone oxidoreductase [Holophagales bacterium]|nr:NAD(P)H-quinone oxidoreductase [Holophagales bacterium]